MVKRCLVVLQEVRCGRGADGGVIEGYDWWCSFGVFSHVIVS
jgi:hypothetical protein